MPNPIFSKGQAAQAPWPTPVPPREIEREWQDSHGKLPPYTHLTMYDLPSEDPEESGLPDEFHEIQPKLLKETCQLQRPDFFVGVDLSLYYDPYHPLWHKRPDWFLAVGVAPAKTQEELRLSYVFWQEQVSPFLVVELLSPTTEDDDLGKVTQKLGKPTVKWDVYEQVLQVPFYVVYDRYENQLRVFALQDGKYQAQELTTPRFWFESLGLGLGLWQGLYQGTAGEWLRWYDRSGQWIPTNAENAVAANTRAEKLAAKLRSLGIDPDQL
jgi:Uma2 family endonuclease